MASIEGPVGGNKVMFALQVESFGGHVPMDRSPLCLLAYLSLRGPSVGGIIRGRSVVFFRRRAKRAFTTGPCEVISQPRTRGGTLLRSGEEIKRRKSGDAQEDEANLQVPGPSLKPWSRFFLEPVVR